MLPYFDAGGKLSDRSRRSHASSDVPLPAELPVLLAYRQVVDAREATRHVAERVELPVLAAVGTEPLSGLVVVLVLEPDGDAVTGEGPQLLLQAIVVLLRPFAPQELDDRCASVDEPGAVPSFGVLGVCPCDPFRIAGVPCVFGRLHLLPGGLFGEGRKGMAGFHISCGGCGRRAPSGPGAIRSRTKDCGATRAGSSAKDAASAGIAEDGRGIPGRSW